MPARGSWAESPATRGGDSPDGRKVKATIHWVSAPQAHKAEVRLYQTLFTKRNPAEDADFKANLNPKSLEVLNTCYVEPNLKDAKPGSRFQFERRGYFFVDPADSSGDKLAFNRIVTLKDTWAKIEKQAKKQKK